LLNWGLKALQGEIDVAYKKSIILVPSHPPAALALFSRHIQENENIKGIFLYRDPRDLIVSFVKSTQAGIWPEGDLAKYYVDKTEREIYLNTMDHYAKTLEQWSPFLYNDSFLNVKYEDLLGVEQGGTPNVQGQTLDLIGKHLNVCSLELARGLITALHRPTWTKRGGGARVGQWKEVFTAEMIEKFNHIYGKLLKEWNYT
jgi:hypothetical protein